MYDAIVVGARCGGAPTAMLLARKGYRVLLVDRARFPADIPHGHLIHEYGPGLLKRWGLLDRLIETGCPPITRQISHFGDGDATVVCEDAVEDGIAWAYAPRRKVLDQLLIDAAVESGVEFRNNFTVDGFMSDGGRITGIEGRSAGAPVQEKARITIGADGRNSRLARFVEAPRYNEQPVLTFYYFSYWSGLAEDTNELYRRESHVALTMPTNDGLSGVFVSWRADRLAEVRADIEKAYLAAIAVTPLRDRMATARREERFYGATDLPNFFRKPYGPGWALVGDAGYHKDPFFALGISDAFRDASLLAEALDEGFSGRRPLEDALAEYEAKRNQASQRDYLENTASASFLPLPDNAIQTRAGLARNPEDATMWLKARWGMIPPERFFNRENLARIQQAGAEAMQSRSA